MASMKAHAPKQAPKPSNAGKSSGGGDKAIREHTAEGLALPAVLDNLVGDGLTQAAQLVERHVETASGFATGPTLQAHEDAVEAWRLLAALLRDAMDKTEKAVQNQATVYAPLFEAADATAAHLTGYPTTVGSLRES